MNECTVKVSNLTKKFRNNIIFQDVNFELKAGQCYGFIGYNGCGKSVLFKIISGLITADEGQVRIFNKILGKDIDFPEDTGIIIETPGFLDGYSGYKNLKFLAAIKNVVTDEEIKKTLELVGLDYKSKEKVKNFSLGMKQRLAIAQAILEKPRLLILDEPFNGLDKNAVIKVRDLIKSFKDKGITIILSSHIIDDIKILCDEVYEFNNKHLKKLDKVN